MEMVRLIGLILVVAACGSVKRPFDDAAVPASQELLSGAGRVKGPTFTLDVEIGHSFSQQRATGTTLRIQGNAAVKP
jgi:hypothetical protein